MQPGRNDPCPCGSGRKYKHCCLRAVGAIPDAELQWRRVRRALEPLNRNLLREAAQHFGAVGLEEAWQEFFLFDVEEPFDPETPFAELFFSWFLYDFEPDPHGTELPGAVHDTTVAQAYLARAGRRLDPVARRYVEACAATPFSFHEVIETRPGTGFRLRDVLLGTEVDVMERMASYSVQVDDCLFARPVAIDGLVLIEAMGPTAIPPAHKTDLIAVRKALARHRHPIDSDTVREFRDELREAYLDIDAALHEGPALRNTDGDPLELHTLCYDLDAPEAALEQLWGLGAAADEPEVERDAAGRLLRADFTWSRAGKGKNAGSTVLGTLCIEGTRLTAEVSSAERAGALRALIEQRLGDTVHVRPGVVQSVQSLLENHTPRQRVDVTAPPETRAVLQEALRGHYREWVDEKLPALNNRTPRKAVRDPDGREAVEGLVAQFERDGARMDPPLDPDIIRELRTTLGLS